MVTARFALCPRRGQCSAFAREMPLIPRRQIVYAGIRYLSRLHAEWECWAVFVDRLQHRVIRSGVAIGADEPGLVEAASVLGLGLEDDHGRRHYP